MKKGLDPPKWNHKNKIMKTIDFFRKWVYNKGVIN